MSNFIFNCMELFFIFFDACHRFQCYKVHKDSSWKTKIYLWGHILINDKSLFILTYSDKFIHFDINLFIYAVWKWIYWGFGKSLDFIISLFFNTSHVLTQLMACSLPILTWKRHFCTIECWCYENWSLICYLYNLFLN